MLKLLFFFTCVFLPAINLQSQTTEHHLPKLEGVWQIGTCNCYLFQIGLWEFTTEGNMQTSRQIDNFHLINGTECSDLKETGSFSFQNDLPVSLRELSTDHPFLLTLADEKTLNKLESLSPFKANYAYTQKYEFISLALVRWEDTENKDNTVFSVSLISNSNSEDSQTIQSVADIVILSNNTESDQ